MALEPRVGVQVSARSSGRQVVVGQVAGGRRRPSGMDRLRLRYQDWERHEAIRRGKEAMF